MSHDLLFSQNAAALGIFAYAADAVVE